MICNLIDNLQSSVDIFNSEGLILALKELDQLSELEIIKESVAEHIMSMILTVRINGLNNFPRQSLNTIIYGPPGVGKSEVARCIAKIYQSFGLIKPISKDKYSFYVDELHKHYYLQKYHIPAETTKFYWDSLRLGQSSQILHKDGDIVYVNRSDLIAHYSGQTTSKTRSFLEKHALGCLIIEEAYILCTSDSDGYGRESLTEISQFIDRKDSPIFIITGYEDQIKQRILDVQPGLARRFGMVFKIDGYSPEGLAKIFEKQINSDGWRLGHFDIIDFFQREIKYFPYFGGDTSRLAYSTKVIAACRILKENFNYDQPGIITLGDLLLGFEKYKNIQTY